MCSICTDYEEILTKHTNSFWPATNIAHPDEFSGLQHDTKHATFWALVVKVARET